MAEKEFKALFTADNKDFKRKADEVGSKAKGLGDKMQGIGKAMIAAFSVTAIIAGVKKLFGALSEYTKLYDIQAKAETSLLVALKGRVDIQQSLIKQASELQKTTLFGDEATIEGAAKLAMLLGQDEKAISRLLPLVQDLAQAKFGGNLVTAADMVAKSVGSSTNALMRYGVEITGAVGSSERLESAIYGLNKQVGGQAEAAAKVGTASLVQLGNLYGDLKEEIGRAVINSAAFNKSIGLLKTKVIEVTDLMSDLNTINESEDLSWWDKTIFKLAKFTKHGREAVKDMASLIEKKKELKQVTEEVDEPIVEVTKNISYYKEQIRGLSDSLDNLTAGQWKQAKGIKDQITAYQSIIDQVLEYKEVIETPIVEAEIMEFGMLLDTSGMDDLKAYSDEVDKFLSTVTPSFYAAEEAAAAFSETMMYANTSGIKSLKDFASMAVETAKRVINVYLAEAVASQIKAWAGTGIFGLIGAGVAAGATVALFNSLIPSFADGGGVSGPTMALVGEAPGISRSNPEYIGTASQLSQMGIGSGGNLTCRVSRGDLLFMLNEGQSANNNNF
jgi:hypothetical protein